MPLQIQESLTLGMVPGDSTEVLQRCGEYTYGQGELRGRVGKERGGKETDRYPLTLPPLQKYGVTTCEDCQEVSRSTLVKGIELRVDTSIWCAAPGICSRIALSSALHVVVYAPPIDCDSHHSPST
jgi:hypothetical protein